MLGVVAAFFTTCLTGTSQTSLSTNTQLGYTTRPMFDVRAFQQASISPDGRQVAWVESQTDQEGAPSTKSIIYVMDLTTQRAVKRVTVGDGKSSREEHDLAWSPDSKQIAFLSDAAEQGQLQLFVTDITGGRSRQLTRLTGFLSAPTWSPNGQSIAFLFTEDAPRAAGPLVAETPDAGVVGEQVLEQRLTTVDLASGDVRQISPNDLYVYEFDWAPNSKHLAITAAHGSGDDNWYVAGLFSIDASSGALAPVLEKPGLQISAPRWSPDGLKIAFIGGLMSDEAIVGGDIYFVASDGRQKTNLTPGMMMSASWLSWLPDSHSILFSAIVDGRTGIEKLDLSTNRVS